MRCNKCLVISHYFPYHETVWLLSLGSITKRCPFQTFLWNSSIQVIKMLFIRRHSPLIILMEIVYWLGDETLLSWLLGNKSHSCPSVWRETLRNRWCFDLWQQFPSLLFPLKPWNKCILFKLKCIKQFWYSKMCCNSILYGPKTFLKFKMYRQSHIFSYHKFPNKILISYHNSKTYFWEHFSGISC